MNLYKISQSVNEGYDTFSALVVCAKDEQDAKTIHPERSLSKYKIIDDKFMIKWQDGTLEEERFGSWATYLKDIKVEYLGMAIPTMKRGIVLSSFHAG